MAVAVVVVVAVVVAVVVVVERPAAAILFGVLGQSLVPRVPWRILIRL